MNSIEKIKLQNFKRFPKYDVEFYDTLNVLIGDNESGKSTILTAIDLVLSGSRHKVESRGLDNLLNSEAVQQFLGSEKEYINLPVLFVELYLNWDDSSWDLKGKYNSEGKNTHGLLLKCEPRVDLGKEIRKILRQDEDNFPFEYYSIEFKTFSGESYTGYRKFLNHLLLDSTQINNEYATRSYITTLYHNNVDEIEKNKHHNEYRKHKENFRADVLHDLNERIDGYAFSIRTSTKANLETDLAIRENEIEIENKGKGRQCFVKTDFALQKSQNDLDLILLEEPENHLSHINMKKLIRKISNTDDKQLIIATHSNLISTRLNLIHAILLNSNSTDSIDLNKLPEDTAKFFMKAPDNNILEFIMSKRVILVEGNAEFILMEAFYEESTGEKLEDSDIHVISVGGTSFKRYLDIAKLLNIKTAVIRDNDGDYKRNCVERYKEYETDNIRVFSETDNDISTFEISMYSTNTKICDDLFGEGRKKLTVEQYMLSNKADSAFALLDKKSDKIEAPIYISQAIAWIRK